MNDFRERTKSQFAVIYLTLISVIQGCVLGYLFTQADTLLVNLTLRAALLLLVSFLMIVLVWNEYMMWTSMVRWVPRLLDSLLPLTMGVLQFGMIRSIPSRSPAYFMTTAAFLAVAAIKYRHAYVVGRGEAENLPLLATLGRWNAMTEWMLVAGIGIALLAAWLDGRLDAGRGTSPWAAGVLLLVPVVYIARTFLFWRFVCPVDAGSPSGG